jgi:hypothetical protein
MYHVCFIRSAHWRYLVAAAVACAALATAGAATAAAAGGTSASGTSVHTVQLVGHETQRKLISQGGFGDEEIFSGSLDAAAGSSQVGTFAGTRTSIGTVPPITLATMDLQLQAGQITVQGFFDSSSKFSIVHAVTGGTGIYRGVRGEFSFTEPSRGVLDITVTLLRS